MKQLKTKKDLRKEAILLYGGNNTQNPPFNIGDKLKQIYRVDDNGNLIRDGREMVEFVGMKGDVMLLKTLNSESAHSEDTINPLLLIQALGAGFKPTVGSITQLHYMYADRYEVINNQ